MDSEAAFCTGPEVVIGRAETEEAQERAVPLGRHRLGCAARWRVRHLGQANGTGSLGSTRPSRQPVSWRIEPNLATPSTRTRARGCSAQVEAAYDKRTRAPSSWLVGAGLGSRPGSIFRACGSGAPATVPISSLARAFGCHGLGARAGIHCRLQNHCCPQSWDRRAGVDLSYFRTWEAASCSPSTDCPVHRQGPAPGVSENRFLTAEEAGVPISSPQEPSR